MIKNAVNRITPQTERAGDIEKDWTHAKSSFCLSRSLSEPVSWLGLNMPLRLEEAHGGEWPGRRMCFKKSFFSLGLCSSVPGALQSFWRSKLPASSLNLFWYRGCALQWHSLELCVTLLKTWNARLNYQRWFWEGELPTGSSLQKRTP